jgi:hypothetical protein
MFFYRTFKIGPLQWICAKRLASLKINSPQIRNFLLKYTQTNPAGQTALRKCYLHSYYGETLKRILSIVQEKKYVFTHKTTNANFVIGVLKQIKYDHRKYFFCHARIHMQ